jgi:hypothetical protein
VSNGTKMTEEYFQEFYWKAMRIADMGRNIDFKNQKSA